MIYSCNFVSSLSLEREGHIPVKSSAMSSFSDINEIISESVMVVSPPDGDDDDSERWQVPSLPTPRGDEDDDDAERWQVPGTPGGNGGDDDESDSDENDDDDEDDSDDTDETPIQIFVKTPTGKTITLLVLLSNTVATAKVMVQNMEGVPVKKQRLIFLGNQLENGTLADHKVKNLGVLTLLLKIAGGGKATSSTLKKQTIADKRLVMHVRYNEALGRARAINSDQRVAEAAKSRLEVLHTMVSTKVPIMRKVVGETTNTAVQGDAGNHVKRLRWNRCCS